MPNQSVAEVPESETRLQMIMLDALPAADGAGLIEIPIAVTGQWKRGGEGFEITSADLQRMAANFGKRKNGEINIDYDHASEMPEVARGGPIPSAGRIVKLRSNGALHALIEFTPRALELIRNREYRFVSPAIHYQAQDKATGEIQGATLTSLALTNRPFLEELPPIKLSEIVVAPVPDQRDSKAAASRAALHQVGKVMELVTLTAGKEVLQLTRLKMKETGISFGEALLLVVKEDPELASEYRAEVLNSQADLGDSNPDRTEFVCPPRQAELRRLAESKVKAGVTFSEALISVAREQPVLASEYREEVIKAKA